MKEEKIQELLDNLFKLKYTWRSSGDSYNSDVINKEGRNSVEQVLRAFLLDSRDEETGVLQAKLFAYEEIIKKSNFAPLILNDKPDEKSI